jgi:uncharacterized protein
LNSLEPTAGKDRIVSIDSMRGFAILGIFLVNMLSFHSPILYLDPFKWWEGSANLAVYRLIDLFVQASFYPLFAMLFGYGLVLFQERTLEKGLSFPKLAFRRLGFLAIMGLLHALFIWHGDILFNYAMLGFLFLLFIRMRGTGLLLTGTLLYILPNLLFSGLLLLSVLIAPADQMNTYDMKEAKASLEIYQNGTFIEIMNQRVTDWYGVNNLVGLIFSIVTIFPFFFIGAWAGKVKLFENVAKHRKTMMWVAVVFFGLGLLIKSVPYVIERNLFIEYVQDIFGGPLFAIAYALCIALLFERKRVQKWLLPLAAVGKLSLSNYLLQSIIFTLIFYQYGLGLYGNVSVVAGTMIAIAFFICQILVSRIWVKNYYYGPFEWVWRSVTYGSWQRWKKQS